MLSKYTDINKFGGYTWCVKLDSLHQILIHETDSDTYVVEFKEWKWISYKTHFSFVSKQDLKQTIIEAIDRTYDFFLQNPKYEWSQQQKENKLNEALQLLPDTLQFNSEKQSIAMKEKYKTLVDFFTDLPVEVIVEEEADQIKLSFSTEDSSSNTSYLIIESNDFIKIDFVQENSEGTFPLHWEYPKETDQNLILEDYQRDLTKLAHEVQMKKVDNMINKGLYE